MFVVPGFEPGFATEAAAAVHAAGNGALLTADTALHLYGVVRTRPRQPTLVLAHGRRAPALAGVRIIRSRTLVEADRSEVLKLPVAAPPRSFLDLTRSCPQAGRLRTLLIDARQRNVTTPVLVIERLAAMSSRAPGRDRLLFAAAEVDTVGSDSVLSDIVHRRLLMEGLLPDARPVEIPVDGGRRLHPDITYASARVCIECDSLAHHSSQRAVDLDHRKDEAYGRARWKCLRIGWRRLDRDWNGFVDTVRHALDEWPRVVAALEREIASAGAR